jgi:VanZ family protein
MAVIFWLSSGVDLPGSIEVPDKAAHFAAYAVLGALLWWAAAPLGVGRAGALAMMVGAIYGAADEFHQHFVPGRTPDPLDWAADVGGVMVAVAIAAAVMGAHRARRI